MPFAAKSRIIEDLKIKISARVFLFLVLHTYDKGHIPKKEFEE